jgi:fructosamine-3-kinase
VSAREEIARALGREVLELRPLSGGCIAETYRVWLEGGGSVVVKRDESPGATLDVEAKMLHYLKEKSRLPVPEVIYGSKGLLVLEYIEHGGAIATNTEAHAAELLAELHEISAPEFGFDYDTLVGPLPQRNPWTASWRDFFRDQRLLAMAHEAYRARQIDQALLGRLERFAEALDRFLIEPEVPSLIHGDVWSGNVLVRGGRIAALIDPSLYYAHAEMELAYIALFNTFGERFFAAYHERRRIQEGFFELRKDIYGLYPLLVHARLFGAPYPRSVARVLGRLGY